MGRTRRYKIKHLYGHSARLAEIILGFMFRQHLGADNYFAGANAWQAKYQKPHTFWPVFDFRFYFGRIIWRLVNKLVFILRGDVDLTCLWYNYANGSIKASGFYHH